MNQSSLRADALLLLTAAIWGLAFVAQRLGMDHMGPFTFNGARFALGSLSLVPLILISNRRLNRKPRLLSGKDSGLLWKGGVLAGLALFAGSSFQQMGIVHTTAGKAGFITGLYVVIVPLLGLFWRQRPSVAIWLGAALATWGLYLLSVTGDFRMAWGDFLVLLGAFCWAAHVLIIGWLSPRVDVLKLSALQFAACAALSLLAAFATEPVNLRGVSNGLVPILYGGLFSVGIAYTLQVVAQRDAHPAHTAILLSLEGVFAALGGWWLLDERLSERGLLGCALILGGMLLSELAAFLRPARTLQREQA